MHKLLVLYSKPADPDHFRDYYVTNHLPLVMNWPGLLAWRYSFDVAATNGEASYFAVFEGDFADAVAMAAARASPHGQRVAADVANYATGGAGLLHHPRQGGTRSGRAGRSWTRRALGGQNDGHHPGGRTFDTVAIRRPAGIEVWFDQGLVALRHPAPDERAAIVAALGLTADDPHPTDAPRIAAPGAPRMLAPVHDRSALLRVHPHLGRLTAACQRYGLLGCFVYAPPVGDRPGAARVF